MKARVSQAAAYIAEGVCEPYDGDKHAHAGSSEGEATLQLLCYILSSGVPALPFAFRSSGCFLGLLLLTGCTLAAVASSALLFNAAQTTGATSYTDLATLALGPTAGSITAACVAAVQLGALVACVNVLADLLSAWAGKDLPAGAEPSRGGVMAAVVALALLPLALGLRSPRGVHLLTAAGTAFIAAFPLALLAHALSLPSHTQMHEHAASDTRLALWRPGGAAVALSVVVYAIGNSHGSMFAVYASLRQPCPERMTAVAASSLCAAAVVYALVGIGGYYTFGESVQGDVLRNFGGGGTAGQSAVPASTPGGGAAAHVARFMAQALRFGYGVSMAAAIPLALLPLRDALVPWAAAAAKQCAHHTADGAVSAAARTWLLQSAITAALLVAVLCGAVMLPGLEFVAALCGCTACVLLSSVLPAAIHLRVMARRRSPGPRVVWAGAAALFVAGLLACAVCTRATLVAVAHEREAVALAQALVTAERSANAKTQRLSAAVAAVATLEAVGVAAEELSRAQMQADQALDKVQNAAASISAKGAVGSTPRRPWTPSALTETPVAPDGAAALQVAAAELASARSQVEFRLAGVTAAVEAMDGLTRLHANATQQEEQKPVKQQQRAGLSPPPRGAAAKAGGGSEGHTVTEAANTTVAAVQHTAAALAAAQQAANSAAGALAAQAAHVRGSGAQASGLSAAGRVDAAAAAAGAASRSSNATLSQLQHAAVTQAAVLERELEDALVEVQQNEKEEKLQVAAAMDDSGIRGAVSAPPPVPRGSGVVNVTTAAQAAVQAVARSSVQAAGAKAVVRAHLVSFSWCVCVPHRAHIYPSCSLCAQKVGDEEVIQRAADIARALGAGQALGAVVEAVVEEQQQQQQQQGKVAPPPPQADGVQGRTTSTPVLLPRKAGLAGAEAQ